MNIAVAGTGYVGLSIATLLSQHGLEDPDRQLVLLGAAGQGDQSWALWPAG